MRPLFLMLFATLTVAVAEEPKLKTYEELGLLAPKRTFEQMLGGAIHRSIVTEASTATVYRVREHRELVGEETIRDFESLSKKIKIEGEDLNELRELLLSPSSYLIPLGIRCGFNPDYMIEFQGHGFTVSFAVCTSCLLMGVLVEDDYPSPFLLMYPSHVELFSILKTHYPDDDFTQKLPTEDEKLAKVQEFDGYHPFREKRPERPKDDEGPDVPVPLEKSFD